MRCSAKPVPRPACRQSPNIRSSARVTSAPGPALRATGFVPAERIRANFDTFAADRFIIGSESQVVDLIGRYGERTGTDHMLLRVQWPGLDPKTGGRTLDRRG